MNCGWDYWWDPPDAFGDIDVSLRLDDGRTFSTTGNGSAGTAHAEVILDGTYLPSMSFWCGSGGVILWPGYSYQFAWEDVPLSWSNSTCDNYPVLIWGADASASYAIDDEFYHIPGFPLDAISNGASYWGYLGSQISYPELGDPPGTDMLIVRADLDGGVVADYNSATRVIRVNWTSYSWMSSDKWAFAFAHEMGHGHGFDDAVETDYLQTIMIKNMTGAEGLLDRPKDKCAVVKAFPVPIQIGG